MPTHQPQKILFVINTISGGSSKSSWEEGIWQYFRQTSCKVELYHTTGQHDLSSVKHWIDNWQPDTIVAVGGDGTVKLCAEALYKSDIPLCIFPAGSANGMAKELMIPSTIEECIQMLLKGSIRSIDLIRINEQLCIHLGDVGLNAQLVKYFQRNNIRGKIGYAREVLRVLWRKRLLDVRLTRAGETISRKAFMIVLANAGTYGTGARINPLSDLSDGLFEVVILKKLSLLELLKMLFLNRPFNPKKTELLQAESLTLQIKRRAYFQVDGEYLGKTRKLEAHIEPSALKLIVPSNTG